MKPKRATFLAGLAAMAALSVTAPAAADEFYFRYKGLFLGGTGGSAAPVAQAISLGDVTFPAARVGKPFSFSFGPAATVTWVADPDTAPGRGLAWTYGSASAPGLNLGPATGELSGEPSQVGDISFEVVATRDGKEGRRTYVIKVGGAALEVTQISVGAQHACAVTPSGGAKCWGSNSTFQLGSLAVSGGRSTVPVDVNGLTAGVASISAGNQHTCAVMTTGVAKCWGDTSSGRIGNNTTGSGGETVPVNVWANSSGGTLSGVASISAGFQHTCAVLNSGTAKCWGSGGYGMLGNNSTADSPTPVDVWASSSGGILSGVASVTTGTRHACAMMNSGTAKCWGYNYYGQLGNNKIGDSHVPDDVAGLSGVSAIKAGFYHTCAISGGGAKCWGSGTDGVLGRGNSNPSPVPVDVQGLASGVTSIWAGLYNSCAVHNGAAKCWGKGDYGALGNGGTTPSPVPINVAGLETGATSISGGTYFACAIHDGIAKCWGINDVGRLGDGTTTNSSVPVDVTP